MVGLAAPKLSVSAPPSTTEYVCAVKFVEEERDFGSTRAVAGRLGEFENQIRSGVLIKYWSSMSPEEKQKNMIRAKSMIMRSLTKRDANCVYGDAVLTGLEVTL